MMPLAVSEQSRNLTRSPVRGPRGGICCWAVNFWLMAVFICIDTSFLHP